MSVDKREFAERVARKYCGIFGCGMLQAFDTDSAVYSAVDFRRVQITKAEDAIAMLEAIEAVREEDARAAVASQPAAVVTIDEVKRLLRDRISLLKERQLDVTSSHDRLVSLQARTYESERFLAEIESLENNNG